MGSGRRGDDDHNRRAHHNIHNLPQEGDGNHGLLRPQGIANTRDHALISKNDNYMVASKSVFPAVWNELLYPEWAKIRLLRHTPNQQRGDGVEPHYHDCDEYWHFISGYGEAWLDGQLYEITPNTTVYTPMGVVHRFQMFTDFDTVDAPTLHEGRKRRSGHLLVELDGASTPTATGFVVAGGRNNGSFPDRGPRCPLTELRTVAGADDEPEEGQLSANEHWVVLNGTARLTLE